MLGDDIALALPGLRAQAESVMTDACLITRLDPDAPAPQMDPETGQYPDAPRLTVYGPGVLPLRGKCRLQDDESAPSLVAAGERQGSKQEYILQLPVEGSGHIAVKDVVTMLSVQMDSSLVDRQYTVIGRHGKSQAVKRQLRVIEGVS